MNVAFHIDQLWFSAPGGIGTYVRELLATLPTRERSLRLTPFHARWRRPAPEGTIPAGNSHRLPEPAVGLRLPIRLLYPAWDFAGIPALPHSLRAAGIVHATNPAAIPPVRRGQRLVVTVHDLAFFEQPQAFPARWRKLYEKGLERTVRRADAILVPSQATARDLGRRTSVDPGRIRVTPLGVRTPPSADGAGTKERLARKGVEPPFLLTVGTIEPRKNLVLLLRAYRRLAAEGLPHSLVVAGPDGWGMEEFSREVARGGPGRVVRTGRLDIDELDAAYRIADVMVYPSRYEGFGLPVAEAMARGVPVVTSNVSSLPEVTGDAALLVDPDDEDGLVEALRRVTSDAGLAGSLRARGVLQAARFTWEACADATLAVYRELLDRPGAAR